MVRGLMALEDLDYIYIVVPRDDDPSQTENLTVRQMSDRQFRAWIVGKGEQFHIPMLPTMGRLGDETRLHMINHLIRKGAPIHRLPRLDEAVR